jgi:hypothetical protein
MVLEIDDHCGNPAICRDGALIERSAGYGWAAGAHCRVSLTPNPGYIHTMSDFMSHFAVPIAIGAVAVVLLLGLVNMMRGGSGNTSQKLMRLRVILQFVAIVVIMLTVWIMSK